MLARVARGDEQRGEEGDERDQDAERERQHDDRVRHRGLHLPAQGVLLLELVGDPQVNLLVAGPHPDIGLDEQSSFM